MNIDYTQLARELARAITPLDPVALWDNRDIANYLRKSLSYVEKIKSSTGFPHGLRIAGGQLRYRAKDVMAWAEKQEGRPRNAV